jgi:hypothetical protein
MILFWSVQIVGDDGLADLDSIPSIGTYEMEVALYKISDLIPRFWRSKFACITSEVARDLPNITMCRECASFLVDAPAINRSMVH